MKLIVANNFVKIEGLDDQSIIRALDQELSFYVQGYEFTPAYKKGFWDPKRKKWRKWDGKTHLLTKSLRFRTGLLDRAKKVLDNNRIEYKIIDKRSMVEFGPPIDLKGIEKRDYQDRIHEACMRNMGGVVKACTGAGKSISIARLVAETNIRTNVYVTSVDLLYQMAETFERVGIEAGVIGDGQAEVKKVNIVSIWTACAALGKKYESIDDEDSLSKVDRINAEDKKAIARVIKTAQMNIWDECHMVACKTIQEISAESKAARYTFGFSGTPFREDNADMFIEAICGHEIIDINASSLIKSKHLVRPIIHYLNVPEYFGSAHTYHSIYKEYIVENDERNTMIVKAVKKLSSVGRRVLILVKNIKHGKILLEKLEDDFVIYFTRGNLDSEERNRIRQEFIEGKIDVVIATAIFDQGVDLKNLDALILAGSGKSTGRALQRIGRAIRTFPGKKDAVVIDFIDNAKYLFDHTLKRIETFRLEPAFKLKFPEKVINAKKAKRLPKKITDW